MFMRIRLCKDCRKIVRINRFTRFTIKGKALCNSCSFNRMKGRANAQNH